MKNMIKGAALVAAVILLVSAAARNRYVGVFIGDGAGITNLTKAVLGTNSPGTAGQALLTDGTNNYYGDVAASGGSQVWTNDGTFTYPSDTTLSNSSFVLRNSDGSMYIGPGSYLDTDINDASWWSQWIVLFTQSNSPPQGEIGIIIEPSEDDTSWYSIWSVQNYGGPNGEIEESFTSVNTNGTKADIKLQANSGPFGGAKIWLTDTNSFVTKIGPGGNITANRFSAASTNAVILPCPDGGSFILTVKDDGTLNVITNSGGL